MISAIRNRPPPSTVTTAQAVKSAADTAKVEAPKATQAPAVQAIKDGFEAASASKTNGGTIPLPGDMLKGIADDSGPQFDIEKLDLNDDKVVRELGEKLGIDHQELTKRAEDDRPFDGALLTKDGVIKKDEIGDKKLKDVEGFTPSNGSKTNETIIQVNGITTTEAQQREVLQGVADKTGAKVVGLHNATEGFLGDLKQCVGDKLNAGKNLAVDSLKDVVLGELKTGKDVHIMAHSQGGLITSRALGEVKKELEKDGKGAQMGKVKVESFGAASGRYPNGPKYVHYTNTKDPISNLFGVDGKASFFANPGMDTQGKKAVIQEFTKGSSLSPIKAHNFKDIYLPERKDFDKTYHPADRGPRLPPGPSIGPNSPYFAPYQTHPRQIVFQMPRNPPNTMTMTGERAA